MPNHIILNSSPWHAVLFCIMNEGRHEIYHTKGTQASVTTVIQRYKHLWQVWRYRLTEIPHDLSSLLHITKAEQQHIKGSHTNCQECTDCQRAFLKKKASSVTHRPKCLVA